MVRKRLGKALNTQIDNSFAGQVASYRPDLPDWGCLLHVSEEFDALVHEEDLQEAMRLIPSRRVFCRDRWDGEFYWLHYGSASLRVRPSMWVSAPASEFRVGEQIELLRRQGENDAGIYHIRDVTLAKNGEALEYWLRRGEMPIERSFGPDDLMALEHKHQLKVGFFQHAIPVARLPQDLETLNVGNLTGGND